MNVHHRVARILRSGKEVVAVGRLSIDVDCRTCCRDTSVAERRRVMRRQCELGNEGIGDRQDPEALPGWSVEVSVDPLLERGLARELVTGLFLQPLEGVELPDVVVRRVPLACSIASSSL